MKTIMIVDNDSDVFTHMKLFALEKNIEIIQAKNSRHGVTTLDANPDVKLILIHTKCPETNQPAYFSLKPGANLKTTSDDPADFLKKPFSKEEFKTFIEQKMRN